MTSENLSTTDPTLRSWVEVAPDSDFPIQNLPYGVFRRDERSASSVCVAIGDHVLDLSQLFDAGLFGDTSVADDNVFARPFLNNFMAAGRTAWTEVRERVSHLLRHDNPALRDSQELRYNAIIPADDVIMQLPVSIRDYTDFYSSIEHATNIGTMFRGADNALMPNWRHIPVGYHGRASSIVLSGTPVKRPCGQRMPEGADAPVYGASVALDFELEMAFYVGWGNELGTSIPTGAAGNHIFGLSLFNDWSARDIQKWEYVPLGPFLGKNFASTVSPWIVTLDALQPFRIDGPKQEPEVLPYLRCESPHSYDVKLEVLLQAEGMAEPQRISESNYGLMYWNMAQQLAHHTVNGCNTQTGDCMASGTISGAEPGTYGSMIELTWRGENPIQLPGGAERKWIHDGDTLIMRGWGQGDGYRVGFGECSGTVLPATPQG